MSYLVLARKWRPRSFEELVGQEHVRRALGNALDSGRIHHAFLFTGTRGVGKTTIARIFAKALNCERGVSAKPCGECPTCRDIDAGRYVDLIEVDAASRTKVDDTRELLDNVQYAAARGRCKVYLIDEVHMLSTHSFNALLKTLEEPPPHVKFLLATTDPQKLPVTVLSRCLQFHLRRLPPQQIADRLAQIAAAEQVEAEPAALRAIARAAEGSMRDALSLLDQVLAFGAGRVREEETRALLGTLDRRHVEAMLEALADGDGARLLGCVAQLDERAPDYGQALGEFAAALQRMAILQAIPDVVADDDAERDAVLAALAGRFSPEDLQLYYQVAIMGRRDLDYAPDARAGFEMCLLRMLAFQPAGADRPAAATPPRVPLARLSTTPSAVPTVVPAAAAEDWSAILSALNLSGMAAQLAAHCTLEQLGATQVRLRLDAQGEMFRRPQVEQRLGEALSKHFGRTLRLEIQVGEAPLEDTPARRQARVEDERQRAAQDAIESDPNVRALRDMFGATVLPGSIKPIG
jgi:DNA polymerase-3 subunit gamma/tau